MTARTSRGSRAKWIPMAVTALAVVASAIVAFPGSASAALPTLNVERRIQNFYGQCLVSRTSATVGDAASDTTCNTQYADERWVFYQDSTDPDYVHLRSVDQTTVQGTSICLYDNAVGHLAELTPCGHTSNQEWFVHYRRTDGYFIMQNKSTGRYLKAEGNTPWAVVDTQPVAGVHSEEWHQIATS